MKSEKEAIAALDILRQSTLHDQAVKARLKNESYLRNLMKELNVNENGIPTEFLPMQSQGMMFMGYNGQPMMMSFPQSPMYNQSIPATVFTEKLIILFILLYLVNQRRIIRIVKIVRRRIINVVIRFNPKYCLLFRMLQCSHLLFLQLLLK